MWKADQVQGVVGGAGTRVCHAVDSIFDTYPIRLCGLLAEPSRVIQKEGRPHILLQAALKEFTQKHFHRSLETTGRTPFRSLADLEIEGLI